MSANQNKSNVVAIITMFFMFAMISFVTNMAAPFGNIWKTHYEWAGMFGNLMNFAAYLFMGIPAGKLLVKIGYKKTALIALIVGFVGIAVQFCSSYLPISVLALVVYLLGAFICGFCVCMLNTVVNPMLNTLGGGGNRGNQLIQTGGALNSLSGTLTPLLAGAMIGTITKQTAMSHVRPLLVIALAVFALSFLILYFVTIPEPAAQRHAIDKNDKHSAWSFRHLVLGVIAIFFYVGIEVGIPGELNFYLSDPNASGAGLGEGAAVIGGAIAAVYWLLMLVGRLASSALSSKVSSKAQLTFVSSLAIALVIVAIALPASVQIHMPGFANGEFTMMQVPMAALFLVLCGLCTSLMWGSIFNLAVEGLGKYTEQASGIFMMMVVGGGIMPLIQDSIARHMGGYMASYWLVVAMLAFILFYAIWGSRNVNKDIKVD